MDISYREREKRWLKDHPLRQWRMKNDLFLKDLGGALGVGYHTIFRWENGMSAPNKDQVAALVKVTENDNLEQELQEWVDRRPVLGKEQDGDQ